MKKISALICFSLSGSLSLSATDKSNTFWREHPVPHTIPAQFAKEPAVIAEWNSALRFTDEKESTLVYGTTHRIIKILDESGIDEFNKMTISLYPDETLTELRARTILSNGTVIEVTKDKIKEVKGEDGSTEMSFAMDGVEKNAEVELLFTYKRPATFFGKQVYQFGIPVLHASFDLESPTRLKFEEKGYNGFPTSSDTVVNDVREIHVEQSNIPALQSEVYSFADVNKIRAEYKLSYLPNTQDNVRKYTWQDLAQRLYTNVYSFTDRENNAVEKFLQSIGVSTTDPEDAKIKKIESAIKSDITLYKKLEDDDARRLDNVIAHKSATEGSMIRLFAACFDKAGVKHELGIAPNKSENVFDPDFENWNSVVNYVYYFPGQKKFLSPTAIYYRYPFTDMSIINSKALFCKAATVGNITNALADIRMIPSVSPADNHNDIDAVISFTPDFDVNADVTYSMSGYCAMGIREAAMLLPQDKLKEVVQKVVSLADKPENITKYTIQGEAFNNYSDNKPLQFIASVKAAQLVEKAGPKYILKIGDVIGRQEELYQTSERKLPIDLAYPHYLNRTITVNIPEGYKILNPETIKMQAEYKDPQGKITTAFYSDYKIDGNKLIVNISEFYTQLHFPVSDYETYRKVINASADFNKVVVLIGKI